MLNTETCLIKDTLGLCLQPYIVTNSWRKMCHSRRKKSFQIGYHQTIIIIWKMVSESLEWWWKPDSKCKNVALAIDINPQGAAFSGLFLVGVVVFHSCSGTWQLVSDTMVHTWINHIIVTNIINDTTVIWQNCPILAYSNCLFPSCYSINEILSLSEMTMWKKF